MSLLSLAILAAGFFLLIKGAGWLVEGASALAKTVGMSELMIGLTIVAFGTSMPELLVNVIASAQGNTDIAIGNVVGSNIANTLLVLGLAACIAPLYVQASTVWKEIPFSLLASVVLFIIVNDSIIDGAGSIAQISRSEGMILMAFFLIFLYYTFGMKGDSDGHAKRKLSLPIAIFYVLLGSLLLPLGGKLVVDSSSDIAIAFGFSEALIGLSLVALGTSLPEVVTACVAVYRGKVDLAVGNVVGSNIFNIFWILGLSAIIRPLAFNPVLNIDLFIVIISSVILFYLVHRGPVFRRILLFWRQRIDHTIVRHEGIALLVGYVAYLVYIGWRG
jgi:cation:H+ antiporter